jgi:hypothetical protein
LPIAIWGFSQRVFLLYKDKVMEKNLRELPFVVNLIAIDKLIEEKEINAVGLYMAYCIIAEWDFRKETETKTTNAFMRNYLKWGNEKLRKNIKILKKYGYLI